MDVINTDYETKKCCYIKEIAEIYTASEIEDLKYQVAVAVRNVQFGRKLLEIEKFMEKAGEKYESGINDWLINDQGKQSIDIEYRMMCKKIAGIPDIDSYLWFGWKNIVILTESIDFRCKFKIKNIFEELEIDESDTRIDNIKNILAILKHYKIYKEVKKMNKNVTFKAVLHGIQKGLDYSSKSLKDSIKKAKRPDVVIRNAVREIISMIPVKFQNKKTPLDDIEHIIAKAIVSLKMACDKGEFPQNLDEDMYIELIQSIIDFGKTNDCEIIDEISTIDKNSDALAERYVAEILL
jgi:hypothetical protein